MGGRIETFVIHLARATGRRAQVDKLLSGTPYPSRILPAVDGSNVSAKDRSKFVAEAPMFLPHYPFSLNAGEYGCFQSHRSVWQAVIDEDLDAGLILEDDVALQPGFEAALALAVQHIGALGYIQFQVRPVEGGEIVAQGADVRLIKPRVTPLRTSAQLVSQDAARVLLEKSKQFDRPVDTFLQCHWHTGLRLACVVPSGVTDRTAETGGSTISSKKSLWEKAKREVLRSRYRRAVKRLS